MNKDLCKKMCIYKIQNNINGKCYIGISKLRFTLRYGGKWWKNTHNTHLRAAVAKYGIDSFSVAILADNIKTYQELLDLEVKFIKEYNSLSNGYNKTSGGRQPIFSPQSNLKKSQSLKLYYRSLKNNPRKGKTGFTHSEQTKQLLSDLAKKRPKTYHTDAHKAYIKTIMTGRKLSETTKEKLSKNGKLLISDKNPNSKKVVNLDTGKIYDTIGEAAVAYGIHRQKIAEVCRGVKIGLPFKFLKDM